MAEALARRLKKAGSAPPWNVPSKGVQPHPNKTQPPTTTTTYLTPALRAAAAPPHDNTFADVPPKGYSTQQSAFAGALASFHAPRARPPKKLDEAAADPAAAAAPNAKIASRRDVAADSGAADASSGSIASTNPTDPSAVPAPLARSDPFWFIQMLRTSLHGGHEFAYMVRSAVGKPSPYNLKIVPFAEVDPHDHYTISAAGVTHCMRVGREETAEFTPLAQWEAEASHFRRVVEIPFFAHYKAWKAHHLWRRSIKAATRSSVSETLEARLFKLDATFQPALLEVRSLCVNLSCLDFIVVGGASALTLDDFLALQSENELTLSRELADFFDKVRSSVAAACAAALDLFEEETGSYAATVEDAAAARGLRSSGGFDATKHDLSHSFLRQAQLRTVCQRISSFIRMVDYIVLSTMHAQLMESLHRILGAISGIPLNEFSIDVDAATVAEEAAAVTAVATATTNADNGDGTAAASAADDRSPNPTPTPAAPLFEVQLYVDKDNLIDAVPSRSDFMCAVDKTVGRVTSALRQQVAPLLGAADFERYVNPVINGRQDVMRGAVEPLDISRLVDESDEYAAACAAIRERLDAHFQTVVKYSATFTDALVTLASNDAFAASAHEKSATLDTWKELMDTFRAQQVSFDAIPTLSPVGIFQVNHARLKEALTPSPRRCLDDIHATLPQLAAARTAVLLNETTRAQNRLRATPEDVADFVDFSDFLAQTSELQRDYSERAGAMQAMYELMVEYRVAVPDAEAAAAKMLEATIGQLGHLVGQCEDAQEERTATFTEAIETAIGQLRTRADELHAQSDDPALLDGDTEHDEAIGLLERLEVETESLAADSARYLVYQETLRVPITRYDEIEALQATLKLKGGMWRGLDEWSARVAAWSEAPFVSLDAGAMQAELNRFLKVIAQCDKGLPANSVLPRLKSKVETFRGVVPVVVALANEALKEHHWRQIEEVLDHPLERGEAGFTLGELLEVKVYEFKAEIETISTAATQERVLEELLAKVENAWNPLEFVVNAYKEQKDVYILGGVDDVYAVLEETQVLVQTILGSRFVGPLQKRVDEWDAKLRLFSDTLDEWLSVQRGWMYLESIFKAQDIQRQLPTEYKQFDQVNRMWLDVMRKTAHDPTAIKCGTTPKLLESFEKANGTLDRIQKQLEDYLETKRQAFPRFFFLSNDELLEILSQARDPQAVQPHLIKCFDNIKRLDFGSSPTSIEISAMASQEGEVVPLSKTVKARGNVEQWLTTVEEAMLRTLRERVKAALPEYDATPRVDWAKAEKTQIVLTVANMVWAREVEARLDGEHGATATLDEYRKVAIQQLEDLAMQVGGELSKLERKTIVALITGDVHNRDIMATMVDEKVDSTHSFTWQMQLRFYWDTEEDTCHVRQVNAVQRYGYEYQGACSRLVVTPLTDRCWMTLTGALHVGLGGSPAGPAGTGKTESVKDLAKGIGRQCVVFNCSDQLDYKMMGKLFSGVAQCGCWTCLDEFNRIDIEVLSVVAQQLLTIRQALLAHSDTFTFEGREIRLRPSCGVFITMNPGYAGRTELPDNLKALFRPVSMMVPDYGLIAEIMLFAEGFLDARVLARKMVKMYKLCSEQLSQQDHYDYGMRQVKSVLVMAGGQKRANPTLDESVSLIRAMQEANVPRFLAEDLPLFEGIIGDLYPALEVPPVDYGELQSAVEAATARAGLQVLPKFVTKVIELYQTFNVRFGVMAVGPTGGGKTRCYQALQSAMGALHAATDASTRAASPYQPVHTYVFNPKCITMGELYGEFNALTHEWTDGIASSMIRHAVGLTGESDDYQWIVFDGPVDALWIENMNTVLDDNMTLCLANGERIKLNSKMHMLFEVQDLAVASPATVSRCGMVYLPPENLGWRPCVRSWAAAEIFPAHERESGPALPEGLATYLSELFEATVDAGLKFVRGGGETAGVGRELVPTVDNQLVSALCEMIKSLLPLAELNVASLAAAAAADDATTDEDDRARSTVAELFCFAYVWTIGGSLDERHWAEFDDVVRESFAPFVQLPGGGDVRDYYVPLHGEPGFKHWKERVAPFAYDAKAPFFSMVVPTVDTTRYSFLLEHFVQVEKPALLTGYSGVGKSVIVADATARLVDSGKWASLPISFSAQTSSLRTQETIEGKLEKRKKVLTAPPGKRILMFVDDVNMPALETYGASPPVELLRQFLDFGGFYDRAKLFWKAVTKVVECCACGPPGGGRNPLTPRFVRHHAVIAIGLPSGEAMRAIFGAIVSGHLASSPDKDVQQLAAPVVASTVDLYQAVLNDLKPIPAKAHYTFNLRDVSKVIQGLLMVKASTLPSAEYFARLWCHEALRVFADRLIDDNDRAYFRQRIAEATRSAFKQPAVAEEVEPAGARLVFGDFLHPGVPHDERRYELAAAPEKLPGLLDGYLDEYNLNNKEMRLVFFWDAVEHISRLCRILRQPRGNAMLVGVGGSGKQSLTRFAAHVSEMECFQIELTKGYGYNEFREDLKQLYFRTGCDGKPVVFLLSDTQLVSEAFLEDVNNILNSGEVPNLFAADEWEKVYSDVRGAAKELGLSESRESLRELFVSRVRENLHIVLAMSPVGSAFRVRCRMFPSLINCCTIDWYDRWPAEALSSVSHQFFESLELGDNREAVLGGLCEMASLVHSSVELMAERFFAEQKRRFYVTPKSFLELISLYLSMLGEKREEMDVGISRLSVGTAKLRETNALVQGMEQELNALQPELEMKSKETEEMLVQVNRDRAVADEKKAKVAVEEAGVKKTAAEVQAMADDAKRDLDAAMPALNSAVQALQTLTKADIQEIKTFKTPPPLVQKVMEAVCILLGNKPDWDSAKKVLSDPQFMNKLISYDKDNIAPKVIKQILKYYEDPEFVPDVVERVSLAARSLCMWVRAMKVYDEVSKVVGPKRQALKESTAMLEAERAKLAKVQSELAEVVAKVDELVAQCDATVAEKQRLQDAADTTSKRLVRAGKLTNGLADEGVRWAATVERLTQQRAELVGNVFVSSAFIAYLGFFTAPYRKQLVAEWAAAARERAVPTSEDCSLVSTLADPVRVRDWNLWGLPVGEYSTENGILATRGKRWPLAIDPQGQANKWMRMMEQRNGSRTVKGSDATILRTIENAIRLGTPVLLEDVGEELDPSLEPVLQKQIYKQGGRSLIRVGDSDVDYNESFRFYMTTKLPNPHYLPEVCIKVTLINFTVTLEGLEDQLLGLVVREERPDLEKQKNSLVISLAADKKKIQELEDKILLLLSQSEGNILDDEVLINTLSDSKVTSGVIEGRVREAEETEIKINEMRLGYKPAATRGSILYFTVADLANVGAMYQFSLEYFNSLFLACIRKSEPAPELEARLESIMEYSSRTIYSNVSRALFGEHKITFSFMLTTAIARHAKRITDVEWTLMLVGAGLVDEASLPVRPEAIDAPAWTLLCVLGERVGGPLAALATDVAAATDAWSTVISAEHPWVAEMPAPYDALSTWHRLLVIKAFRPEKLIECIGAYITAELGSSYVEVQPLDLAEVYPDATAQTPLVFVLSAGADPMSSLLRFAEEVGVAKNMAAISLGQGQGPIAERLIAEAKQVGKWVVLQNCHLAKSWMPKLEKIVEGLAAGADGGPGSSGVGGASGANAPPHPDFRLWLSSMPADYFPVPVLQTSVKMTFEPPKGLRANLRGTWASMRQETWDACSEGAEARREEWHRLLYGLTFFHAVVQERRKFGPLGWNIRYEFNSTDIEMSVETLRMFLTEQEHIPWEALLYVTGHINYGGRVTDDWDRRCLMTTLHRFYCEEIFADGFELAPGYAIPPAANDVDAVRDFVDALSHDDPVGVFGMHANARITYERQETQRLFSTVTAIQPRLGGGGGGSEEDTVMALAEKLRGEVPAELLRDDAGPATFAPNEAGELSSLQIVLLHEMGRFNRLLRAVSTSLEDLGRAIKGLVVMSGELDDMYGAMLKNQVPALWEKVAYPSLKPLSSWMRDLAERVAFMRGWLTGGPPACFALPAFFFPQGFMTGILQMHARRYAVPIDSLSFTYEILEAESGAELEAPPDDGVYIDGFFLDGARWDRDTKRVSPSQPKVMYDTLPVIHFVPTANAARPEGTYECPLYKTAVRAGVLSTTGQSTNFVVAVDLPTDREPHHWVSMGVAMLCALAE